MRSEILSNYKYDRDNLFNTEMAQTKTVRKLERSLIVHSQVLSMIQETVREIQNKLKVSLTAINQQALDITFPGYGFEMEFTTKKDVPFAGVYVTNHGKRQKPMDSNGGGLSAVIAMCSQMAAKKLSNTRDTILADQPMKDVSKGDKEARTVQMLKQMTKDLGIQYIMISHIDAQIDSSDHTIKVKLIFDDALGYNKSIIE